MLVTLAIATAGLLAVLVARSAMKLSRSHSNDSGDFVPGGFQVDRYRPMERLLLAEELKTLEAQPGYKIGRGHV